VIDPQLTLFVDAGRIESLEHTSVDLGVDTARSLEERIADNGHLRARLSAMERLVMDQSRVHSDFGDRLRMIEIRVGIRPRPALPSFALDREVAVA